MANKIKDESDKQFVDEILSITNENKTFLIVPTITLSRRLDLPINILKDKLEDLQIKKIISLNILGPDRI